MNLFDDCGSDSDVPLERGGLACCLGAPDETPGGSSTRTEVRSPTSTSTEVRSPTSTSTEAYTADNVTVTGGAGAGATTSVTIHSYPNGLGDALPDDEIEPPSGLPSTIRVSDPQGTGYTIERGVVRLAPVQVDAVAPPNPQAAFNAGREAEGLFDASQGVGLPVFTAQTQDDGTGTMIALGAAGLLGLALLGKKTKKRAR